jgi:ABC-type nitrate/sulfonate/bicarbonate transport system substrate-binding protein
MVDIIRVGGVPEHFNLPWHIATEERLFNWRDLEIKWKDFHGGTGAMTKALRNKEIDVAILLTEGIVMDIIKGNPSKIVGEYIQSPLQWGVHVGAQSDIHSLEDLKDKKAAISRFGSGSHLMSYVFADNYSWDLDKLKFEVVNNLDGGREALTTNQADYFLWEKYTTQPYVDKGEFRRIGVCPTPWPSFVIAVREECLKTKPAAIRRLLKAIYLSNFSFVQNPDACANISERYKLDFDEVKNWFRETQWAIDCKIEPEMLDRVQDKLLELNRIDSKVDSNSLIEKL